MCNFRGFNAGGGDMTFIALSSVGLFGNSHMHIQDNNNLQVADMIMWSDGHVEAGSDRMNNERRIDPAMSSSRGSCRAGFERAQTSRRDAMKKHQNEVFVLRARRKATTRAVLLGS